MTPRVPTGADAVVTVTTDDPDYAKVTIPVRKGRGALDMRRFIMAKRAAAAQLRNSAAGKARAVEIKPNSVSFGSVGSTGVVSRTVRVSFPLTNQPFRVTGAMCDDPRFMASVETVATGREYQVRIATAVGPRVPGAAYALLTVLTDHPDHAMIDIPVYMRVQDAHAP